MNSHGKCHARVIAGVSAMLATMVLASGSAHLPTSEISSATVAYPRRRSSLAAGTYDYLTGPSGPGLGCAKGLP